VAGEEDEEEAEEDEEDEEEEGRRGMSCHDEIRWPFLVTKTL